MVTTLYLVRHGHTEGKGAPRYYGSVDIALSPAGIRQMERTSAFIADHLLRVNPAKYQSYLKDIHITKNLDEKKNRAAEKSSLGAVYTSDLSRAVKSAEIIARPHGLTQLEMTAFRERSFGIWEGMTFAEIKEKYPDAFEAWAHDPLKFSPPEGESTSEVTERVWPAFQELLAGHRGDNICLVAHGGINRIIICQILGIPLENLFRIEQDHGAVNIIEFWDMYPVVKLLNGQA